MNWLFWPTALFAAGLFWVGNHLGKRIAFRGTRACFVLGSVVLALPGMLIGAYYTKLLGEPIWLYQFRATPGSELTAAGMGLLAGYVHSLRLKHPVLRREFRGYTIPAILALAIAVPYLKPIVRPLKWHALQSRWTEDVCLQSTPSTCGPASAATLCRLAGKPTEETELARESFSYAGGTENWYLARALRKRGLIITMLKQDTDSGPLPTPAIAGVKLAQDTGHFIALLRYDGTNYLVGDPLVGAELLSPQELASHYKFTGYFMLVR